MDVTTVSFPASNGTLNLASIRVVVVEDEPANVRLLERLLSRLGVCSSNVLKFADGAWDALAVLPLVCWCGGFERRAPT